MLKLVLIIIEAVRPYPGTKQVRSTNNQKLKRVPLQDTSNRINEKNKRRNKKLEPKRNGPLVATQRVKKDDYSLDNLRAIFEEEEKKDVTKIEFRATSTPFNSQLVNSQAIEEEQINNQRLLDLEINKIHDSINKESLILLIEQLSQSPITEGNGTLNKGAANKSKKSARPRKAGQQIGAKRIPKVGKSNTKKNPECPAVGHSKKTSNKKGVVNVSKRDPIPKNKRDQLLETSKKTQTRTKSQPVSKCRTRLESKSKVNSKSVPKAPFKSKLKSSAKTITSRTRSSKLRYKDELTYKQLLLKCAKGKDPIDLLL